MAMPKKGIRRIVIEGNTFKYIIKPFHYGSKIGGRLTIESLDGSHYCSRDIVDQITPAMVRAYAEENLDFLTGKNDHDLSKSKI